ncbi:hypothetical protein [Malacoplasma iowae]|uniref:hypothetical protein n=1 Tax=Malacoplasma iowae TaxID=2116 RepID=UPI003872A92C|nr:hypothetical protein QX181_00330 [Malacoplasma iowae]
MKQNKNFKKDVFEKLDLLKSKFVLEEDLVSNFKINKYTLFAFLFIGIIGAVVCLLLFVSLILMHTINALYTSAPLNILFIFLNLFLLFNNVYFITFCVVSYVIYKKEKRNIMFFIPITAITLTTLSSILIIISLATNIFAIDWAVFFIQLIVSLISLFFFFNNYPNMKKRVNPTNDNTLKLNAENKANLINKQKQIMTTQNKISANSNQKNMNNKLLISVKNNNDLKNAKDINKSSTRSIILKNNIKQKKQ